MSIFSLVLQGIVSSADPATAAALTPFGGVFSLLQGQLVTLQDALRAGGGSGFPALLSLLDAPAGGAIRDPAGRAPAVTYGSVWDLINQALNLLASVFGFIGF